MQQSLSVSWKTKEGWTCSNLSADTYGQFRNYTQQRHPRRDCELTTLSATVGSTALYAKIRHSVWTVCCTGIRKGEDLIGQRCKTPQYLLLRQYCVWRLNSRKCTFVGNQKRYTFIINKMPCKHKICKL